MNILDIENKRQNLLEILSFGKSPRNNLFLISIFFDELLSENNNITESFFLEFIEDYISYLAKYDPTGIPPRQTNKIIQTAITISKLEFLKKNHQQIYSSTEKIELKLNYIKKTLDGKPITLSKNTKLQFPVLEHSINNVSTTGLLESVKIVLQKHSKSNKDSFTIIPSYIEIEEKIREQIERSWQIALKYSKQYVKIKNNHKVIIEFKNKYGEYIGDSLGIVLVLSFIQALLEFYDSRYFIAPIAGVAFTGAVDSDESIPRISNEIIVRKVKTCFYSNIQSFVIPREDETATNIEIENLIREFPKRGLEIVGLKNINELLNRRDLINVKKQNLILWGLKKYYKNKLALIFSFILLIVFAVLAVKDLDYNPAMFDADGTKIIVKNQYGKTLWTKSSTINFKTFNHNHNIIEHYIRLIDINNDSVNEVITIKCYEKLPNSLVCYNYKGEEIWEFFFDEKSEVQKKVFSQIHSIRTIIGVLEINGNKEIVIQTQINNWFPSTILKLNVATGEKTGNTLWHPGGLAGGEIGDFNGDGKLELISYGISNSYECAVVFSIDYDKLSGRAPATEKYSFLGMDIADFNNYILLPKTDYNGYAGRRYNNVWIGSSITENNFLHLQTNEGISNTGERLGLNIIINPTFDDFDIFCGDNFVVVRDSLVAHDKISEPYTATEEYTEILKKQIKYWDGEKFVKMY